VSTRAGWHRVWILARIAICTALLGAVTTCTSPGAQPGATPPSTASATPAGEWEALLRDMPYPYSIPLPPRVSSPVDGTYAKIEPEVGERVPCKRCPDYAAEGGTWKLSLHDGVFRTLHVPSGWRSLGSFTTFYDQNSAERIDQLVLFNDPYCPGVVGLYNWRLDGGALYLDPVGDACSMGLRAANLARQPWLSCTPPNAEAGISDHWQKPPGCD
jgi:hypothetical protein